MTLSLRAPAPCLEAGVSRLSPAHVETFTEKGFAQLGLPLVENEDCVVDRDPTFALIDGAKPPQDVRIEGMSSAAHLARFIGRNLGEAQNIDDVTFGASLIHANSAYRDFLIRTGQRDVLTLGKRGPAASVVGVRIHPGNFYSWAQSGDALLFEFQEDGRVIQVPDHSDVSIGNEPERRRWVHEELKRGRNFPETVNCPEYLEMMRVHAEGRNVSRSTLNGEPEFGDLLQHGERALDGVLALVMFTDGMALPVDHYEHDNRLTAQQILDLGAVEHYGRIKSLYEGDRFDSRDVRFVRFKHMDDASSLRLRFRLSSLRGQG